MDKKREPSDETDEILRKLRHFCSFQERSTSEVKEKLHSLGAAKDKFPGIIEQLRKDNFLNDERFAGAFAHGKFRINRWGRVKIRYELAGRGIPAEVISKALEEIDEDEYLAVIRELVQKKLNEIKGQKKLTIRNKIFTFVSGKGFETGLISEVIKEMNI
jgi:regulatory protein